MSRSPVPATPEAYRLFHEGSLAFSRIEAAGMRIDLGYLDRAIEKTSQKITSLAEKLKQADEYSLQRKRYGQGTNLTSREQLATVLFEDMGFPCESRTKTGRPQLDETALERVGTPYCRGLLRMEKLNKLHGTYLLGVRREVEPDGFMHPSFNLNKVRTYRGCVAKGTLIEVVRDVEENPKGIPIESVKVGDYVYCYDDDLRLCIRRVLWAGKTGNKRVVRLHWSARGKHGYLDVTPEHLIRKWNGVYEEARSFDGADFRDSSRSKHAPKRQVLSLGRNGERLYETGKQSSVLDHELVYEHFIGPLKDDQIIHHKDGNHLNNVPSNLIATTLKEHPSFHESRLIDPDVRKKALLGRVRRIEKELAANGCVSWCSKENNGNWIHISKFGVLRVLARACGKIARSSIGFGTLRDKINHFGIDVRVVKSRYTPSGEYISVGSLRTAAALGHSFVQKRFGIGYYRAKEILEQRGFPSGRRFWKNQVGEGKLNNHKITKVEWLEQEVDVYDIEVEDYHNFIANEICVHNSGSDPNFQNIPIRNKEIAKIIRRAFIPRDGHVLVELDYGQIEVRVACALSGDEKLTYDTLHGDMHRDMAAECFMLDQSEVTKSLRGAAKGGFVFAEFYGDWHKQVAKNLWNAVGEKTASGTMLEDHLNAAGITRLGDCDPQSKAQPGTFEDHIRKVEDRFWNVRFKKYHAWRQNRVKEYRRDGWFSLVTGFICQGVYSKNQVINFPIQGPAFHCLLWSVTRLVREMQKRKMRSRVIGQIHDSIVADVHQAELDDYVELATRITVDDIRQEWDWITVPLVIEVEVAETNWFEKVKYQKPVSVAVEEFNPSVCKACGGTGKNSKGGDCVPCKRKKETGK